jgi:hypothetical protein
VEKEEVSRVLPLVFCFFQHSFSPLFPPFSRKRAPSFLLPRDTRRRSEKDEASGQRFKKRTTPREKTKGAIEKNKGSEGAKEEGASPFSPSSFFLSSFPRKLKQRGCRRFLSALVLLFSPANVRETASLGLQPPPKNMPLMLAAKANAGVLAKLAEMTGTGWKAWLLALLVFVHVAAVVWWLIALSRELSGNTRPKTKAS